MCVVTKKQNSFLRFEVTKLISDSFPNLSPFVDEIITALISEYILIRDSENATEYRFRHSRLIEYLVAYKIVLEIESTETITSIIDELITNIFESGIVSMYSVHDFTRYICSKEFPSLLTLINQYYANSHQYMSNSLQQLRTDIAHGASTSEHDIKLILKTTKSSVPGIAWDSFFVLTAKNNKQPLKILIDAFEVAWKSNDERPDRWKLIKKISAHGLLLHERVFLRILESHSCKEWQVYLGSIIESKSTVRDSFSRVWNEAVGERLQTALKLKAGDDWKCVNELLEIILENREYIPGDMMTQ
jgi:hypothetical protein